MFGASHSARRSESAEFHPLRVATLMGGSGIPKQYGSVAVLLEPWGELSTLSGHRQPEPDRSHFTGVDEGTSMSVTTRTLAVLLGMFMFTGLLGGLPTEHSGQHAEAAKTHTGKDQRVRAMKVALAQRGDPYRYGAAGPNAFDCSGLTKFAYGRVGRSIPRTTDQQKAGLRAVAKSAKRRGDIILFVNGGNAYHAGVYIGKNKIVHSSRSGTPVKVDRIWTSSYVVRRP